MAMAKNNTSGHTGVHWDICNKRWKAHLISYGIYIDLGSHELKQDAIDARVAGVKEFGRIDYPYN